MLRKVEYLPAQLSDFFCSPKIPVLMFSAKILRQFKYRCVKRTPAATPAKNPYFWLSLYKNVILSGVLQVHCSISAAYTESTRV